MRMEVMLILFGEINSRFVHTAIFKAAVRNLVIILQVRMRLDDDFPYSQGARFSLKSIDKL